MAPTEKRIAERIPLYIILFSVLIHAALWNMPVHALSNDQKPKNYQIHTVKAGDSLSKIVYRYYGDYTKIASVAKSNHIKDINRLKIGQKIKIPVLSSEPHQKSSSVVEEGLDASEQGKAETLEETGLNKGPIYLRLGRPTVIFIIICLFTMLVLALIKWLGMKDVPHPPKPDDERRLGFKRPKWRMK
ncbi:MAG: LysM domain-containing protein [Desulfobacterales bacterium]|nr:LysM domain-containing protein [Desulfobacterales bacterium]